MNKKIKNLFLAGALVLGFAGMAVSCKDYQPDIDALDSRLTKVESALQDLQNQIKAGYLLTNVSQAANGAVTLTLSDGKTYTIPAGKDGVAGAKGEKGDTGAKGEKGDKGDKGDPGAPGTVVTIGENGNWFLDGVDTHMAAQGKDGKPGENGKDGQNGKDGKDGGYYYPAEDGFFYFVDAENPMPGKKTDVSYIAAGSVSAVWADDVLTLYNVEGGEGENKKVVIALSNELKGLVFIPMSYVDGVEAMLSENFAYVPMTLSNKDKINFQANGKAVDKYEVSAYNVYDKATTTATGNHKKGDIVDPIVKVPTVIAQYYVNPANAKIDLKEGDPVTFVYHDAEYLKTRAESKDLEVVGTFRGVKDGIMTVEVAIEGLPAVEDSITVAALQVVKEDGSTVTSDFATIIKNNYDALRIAEPNAVAKKHWGKEMDVHYRRAFVGVNKVDNEYVTNRTATAINATADKLEDVIALCDTTVMYNKSLDLKKIVAVHGIVSETDETEGFEQELSAAKVENMGLTWKFEVVKNYLVGKNLTPQDEFVTLADGIFTPRVFEEEEYARAAVGRTPIIRVTLLDGTNTIEVAYIKVCIVDDDYVEPDVAYEFNIDPIGFDCEKGGETVTTVKQMNEFYTSLKVYKNLFHEEYTTLVNLADDYNDKLVDQLNALIAAKKITEDEAEVLYIMNVEIGDLEEVADTDDEGGATHLIKWTMTPDEIWQLVALGREDMWIHGIYENEKGNQKGLFVLKAKIADLAQAYDVTEPMYIPTYWNAAKTITDFNATQPASDKDDNPDNCVFVNNLNAPFQTWGIPATDAAAKKQGVPGLIKLDKAVTALNFFFHEQNLNRTAVGTIKNVIFEISEDGTELYATVYDKAPSKQNKVYASTNGIALYKPASGAKVVKAADGTELKNQLIATIDNTATGTDKQSGKTFQANSITLNKDGVLAKMFLNEARTALHVFIGAVGQVCNDEEKEVAITFKGKEYFEAEYIRPIEITEVAADHFIDGVDHNEKGSYIEIDKLIAPKDWRNREFGFLETRNKVVDGKETEETEQVPVGHYNYWGFYGPFEIIVDKANVKTDITGKVEEAPLTLEIDQVAEIEGVTPKAENGYVTYFNNGSFSHEDFNLYLAVQVNYGWGTINVKDLKVPVWGTEHSYE